MKTLYSVYVSFDIMKEDSKVGFSTENLFLANAVHTREGLSEIMDNLELVCDGAPSIEHIMALKSWNGPDEEVDEVIQSHKKYLRWRHEGLEKKNQQPDV